MKTSLKKGLFLSLRGIQRVAVQFLDLLFPVAEFLFRGDNTPCEFEVLIDIRTLEVMRGAFPRRALSLVLEWASLHREELMEDWKLCETKRNPNKISPLE